MPRLLRSVGAVPAALAIRTGHELLAAYHGGVAIVPVLEEPERLVSSHGHRHHLVLVEIPELGVKSLDLFVAECSPERVELRLLGVLDLVSPAFPGLEIDDDDGRGIEPHRGVGLDAEPDRVPVSVATHGPIRI
jgi:hypothetical protein